MFKGFNDNTVIVVLVGNIRMPKSLYQESLHQFSEINESFVLNR